MRVRRGVKLGGLVRDIFWSGESWGILGNRGWGGEGGRELGRVIGVGVNARVVAICYFL